MGDLGGFTAGKSTSHMDLGSSIVWNVWSDKEINEQPPFFVCFGDGMAFAFQLVA